MHSNSLVRLSKYHLVSWTVPQGLSRWLYLPLCHLHIVSCAKISIVLEHKSYCLAAQLFARGEFHLV